MTVCVCRQNMSAMICADNTGQRGHVQEFVTVYSWSIAALGGMDIRLVWNPGWCYFAGLTSSCVSPRFSPLFVIPLVFHTFSPSVFVRVFEGLEGRQTLCL